MDVDTTPRASAPPGLSKSAEPTYVKRLDPEPDDDSDGESGDESDSESYDESDEEFRQPSLDPSDFSEADYEMVDPHLREAWEKRLQRMPKFDFPEVESIPIEDALRIVNRVLSKMWSTMASADRIEAHLNFDGCWMWLARGEPPVTAQDLVEYGPFCSLSRFLSFDVERGWRVRMLSMVGALVLASG